MAAARAFVPRHHVAAVLGWQLLVRAPGTFHHSFQRGVRVHALGTGNPYAGEVMNPEALVAMPGLVPDEYFRDAVRIFAPWLFRTRTLLRRYAKTNLATSGA